MQQQSVQLRQVPLHACDQHSVRASRCVLFWCATARLRTLSLPPVLHPNLSPTAQTLNPVGPGAAGSWARGRAQQVSLAPAAGRAHGRQQQHHHECCTQRCARLCGHQQDSQPPHQRRQPGTQCCLAHCCHSGSRRGRQRQQRGGQAQQQRRERGWGGERQRRRGCGGCSALGCVLQGPCCCKTQQPSVCGADSWC